MTDDPLTPGTPPIDLQEHSALSSDNPPPRYHKQHHRRKAPKRMPLDTIDIMDDSVPPNLLRHHSGPFDAVAKSMYLSENKNPLAALEHSTQEVLEATPDVSIQDAIERHMPLQNTAIMEPGQRPFGCDELQYEEENLLGDVGRWQGIEYVAGDKKARGPSYWGDKTAKAKRKPLPANITYVTDSDSNIAMVPPELDLRVEGMPASANVIEETKAEQGKHLGIVEGIKRKLSGRRNKHREGQ